MVEARNKQGELFGFERTARISKQSADSVAKIIADTLLPAQKPLLQRRE